jgi:hypothetical protein
MVDGATVAVWPAGGGPLSDDAGFFVRLIDGSVTYCANIDETLEIVRTALLWSSD